MTSCKAVFPELAEDQAIIIQCENCTQFPPFFKANKLDMTDTYIGEQLNFQNSVGEF